MSLLQRRAVTTAAAAAVYRREEAETSQQQQQQQQTEAETEAETEVEVLEQESWTATVHWDALPRWLQDNHHIHTGYRPASASFLRSFHSLTYVHNETVNIYTHLLPALLTLPTSFVLYRALSPRYHTATPADIVVFSCFFAGAAFCLGMSALYHTISNHSPWVAYIGNACDYLGIIGLITGSFIPSIYYGFYCTPQLQRLYWGMIVVLGAGCAAVATIPRFRKPALRPFRAAMFVALGLSAVFPVTHGVVVLGFSQARQQIGLDWLITQGALYIIGAAIYAARVPECLHPGKYDIIGHSHQIFHVLVVLAAGAHLTGLLGAFDYRHSLATQC
ncbi:hemolysin-III channel protein Izh2 [Trichophyton interdigitale]|nr:hemolysin-III channel protein Izh2 [Trichophyton interdigitale]KAG5218355.1 hemolysin-III channel protein Izh2 [Trichophyton interdigitale]KAG8208526.1 hemolysin-III channel protein Izh2 [Trichophyton interdigitale]